MRDISIKPLSNIIVDNFIADNDLFALFDSFPANVLFLDNFVSNIDSFRDVFIHLGMCGSIFFSCKANKSYSLLKMAAKRNCGIEVSSYYELTDALKFTKKIIASGPAKDDKYLSCAIENDSIIS